LGNNSSKPTAFLFAAMLRFFVEATLQYAIDISQSAIKRKRNRKEFIAPGLAHYFPALAHPCSMTRNVHAELPFRALFTHRAGSKVSGMYPGPGPIPLLPLPAIFPF
jgi:hypothetical protein